MATSIPENDGLGFCVKNKSFIFEIKSVPYDTEERILGTAKRYFTEIEAVVTPSEINGLCSPKYVLELVMSFGS